MTHKPSLPTRDTVINEMNAIFTNLLLSDTYKGIHLMLYAMCAQLFLDGNKRTAIIGTNMWLTQQGLD